MEEYQYVESLLQEIIDGLVEPPPKAQIVFQSQTPILPNTLESAKKKRQERIKIYRDKKLKRRTMGTHYAPRKQIAQKRLRIGGRFISGIETEAIQEVFNRNFINQNNSLDSKAIRDKLHIVGYQNELGYRYIRKQDIMQNIHKLIRRKNEVRATNEILDNLFLKKRIFKLIN